MDSAQLIAEHLGQIKALLILAILILVVMFAVWLVATRSLSNTIASAFSNDGNHALREHIAELLDQGKTDAIIELTSEHLRSHPDDVTMVWYRALAFYRKGSLHESQRQFKKVLELAPDWEASVEPYLEQLVLKLRDGAPKLVK
ncbi:MAG: hypothetical protein OET44_08470 [Gammaproteobacteria bacterium]|nr:hypothetical protein [Gammaproteobacteria bacterium]